MTVIDDFDGLDLRMREDAIGREDVEWRELPDHIRVEHTVAYLRICDFAETLAESMSQMTPQRSEQVLEMAHVAALSRRSIEPAGIAFYRAIWHHVADYVSDNLEERWDRVRDEQRREWA